MRQGALRRVVVAQLQEEEDFGAEPVGLGVELRGALGGHQCLGEAVLRQQASGQTIDRAGVMARQDLERLAGRLLGADSVVDLPGLALTRQVSTGQLAQRDGTLRVALDALLPERDRGLDLLRVVRDPQDRLPRILLAHGSLAAV